MPRHADDAHAVSEGRPTVLLATDDRREVLAMSSSQRTEDLLDAIEDDLTFVLINAGCVFLDQASITIGPDAMLGPQVRLCTTTHDLNPALRHTHTRSSPISIGANAWIGAGTVILPGVSIGENSVVGANSVVNADVPANAMYAGSPARFKKWLVPQATVENHDGSTHAVSASTDDATPG